MASHAEPVSSDQLHVNFAISVYEDHLVSSGGALIMAKIKKDDTVLVIAGKDQGNNRKGSIS
jgi:hypothetical protein